MPTRFQLTLRPVWPTKDGGRCHGCHRSSRNATLGLNILPLGSAGRNDKWLSGMRLMQSSGDGNKCLLDHHRILSETIPLSRPWTYVFEMTDHM